LPSSAVLNYYHKEGRLMNRMLRIAIYLVLVVAISGGASFAAQDSQPKKITQTAGVDNTRMGAYQALAEMSYHAFRKGDIATSAELTRVLERTWDRGENQERAPGKPNADLYNQIDKAMDAFIEPILNYNPVRPDKANAENAYKDVLAQLKPEGMGTYRAEVTSTYEALQKDNLADAKRLAKQMLLDWRSASEDLRKSNPDAWKATTQLVVIFARPIARYAPDPPDPVAVETAYNQYLAKLKQAD
jgi:hypothetical protein